MTSGNAAAQADQHALGVQVDHVVQRLDEHARHDRAGVLFRGGGGLCPQQLVQGLRAGDGLVGLAFLRAAAMRTSTYSRSSLAISVRSGSGKRRARK